jgi:hypothetical protein
VLECHWSGRVHAAPLSRGHSPGRWSLGWGRESLGSPGQWGNP